MTSDDSLFDRVASEMAAHLGGDARATTSTTRGASTASAPASPRRRALTHASSGRGARPRPPPRARRRLHAPRRDAPGNPRDSRGRRRSPELVDPICHCVAVHEEYSFEDDPLTAETLEAEVLQDADNLDAIGAVGVARAFQFGGAHGNLLWDPDRPLPDPDDPYRKDGHDDHDGPASTYHHFHAKLLRLHENMNTETGRDIAAERHAFLEEFAERFEKEWYGGVK